MVWQYVTNTEPGSSPMPLPTRAVRLENGLTLISDQFNDRVIEVDQGGSISRTLGQLNTPGYGGGLLNASYDARGIGTSPA